MPNVAACVTLNRFEIPHWRKVKPNGPCANKHEVKDKHRLLRHHACIMIKTKNFRPDQREIHTCRLSKFK